MGLHLLQFVCHNSTQYRVQLFLNGRPLAVGYLPFLPSELRQALENWRKSYRDLVSDQSLMVSTSVAQGSVGVTGDHYDQLKCKLNLWLHDTSQFSQIREKLAAHRQNDHEFRIVLDFDCGEDNLALKQLPWQRWELLQEYYPNSEVTLSAQWGNNRYPYPRSSKIRILFILGQNISTEDINDVTLHYLFDLPNRSPNQVEIRTLSAQQGNLSIASLQQELVDESGYHILICIVHSRSSNDGNAAYLQLSNHQELNINSFYQTLNIAAQNGLKLAILDSCANYGAANRFAGANLQFILVKELIPVDAAAAVLNEFFRNLSERGYSLLRAVHKARAVLEGYEDYPGVADLPTVYIEPHEEPLTWDALLENLQTPVSSSSAQLCQQAWLAYQQALMSQLSDAYDTAISRYTQAIERNEGWDDSLNGYNLARAYHDRGRCYERQCDFSNALEDYNQAVTNNPDYADAYFHRGQLLRADNRRSALADFRQAVRLYSPGSEGHRSAEEEIHALAWRLLPDFWHWVDRRRRGLMLFASLSLLVLALVLIPGLIKRTMQPGRPLSPSTPVPTVISPPSSDKDSPDIDELIGRLQNPPPNQPRSPEDIIYLNNAIVTRATNNKINNNVLKIAAVVPGGNSPDRETLRGVAQAQSEFNCPNITSLIDNVIKKEELDECQGKDGNFLEVVLTTYTSDNNDLGEKVQELNNSSPPVLGVVGRYVSRDLKNVAPYYQANQLLLITTTSNAARKRLDLSNPYVYRIIPDATVVAERLKSEFEREKIEIVRNTEMKGENAYAGSLETEVKEILPETITNLNPFCSFGGADFNSENCARSIKGSVIFLIPNLIPDKEIQHALSLIKEIAKNRPEIKVVGSDTLYDGRLLTDDPVITERPDELGKISAKLEVLVLVPWARTKNNGTTFEKGALALWSGGLINWRTAMAYDATKVLIQGLKDNPTREGLKATLSNKFVLGEQADTTATGRIEFEDNGDRKPYPQVFVGVRQDKESNTGYNFFFLK